MYLINGYPSYFANHLGNCHCSSLVVYECLVKNMYYPNMDFKEYECHMHKQPQIIQF